jgi:hypothetical protein
MQGLPHAKVRRGDAAPLAASPERREIMPGTPPLVSEQPTWTEKLAPSLSQLEERVAIGGNTGNYTLGSLRVVDHLVDVLVYLRDTSPETLAALRQIGFEMLGESKTVPVLVGRIDVRRLQALAQLEVVSRILPVLGERRATRPVAPSSSR